MGMGIATWEWEGMGFKNPFPQTSNWNHGVGTLKRWNHGTMILNKRTSGWSRSGGLGGRVLEAEQFLLT